ncbi:Scavenger_mRNA_decapping_enzyme_C-term_binding/HIT_domain_containing_protein (plasmid) [Leishmania braziliensis MHOM/BR/75/M2904]|uniref:Scavenger mRNA decapping enzyme C-term binding/HIT domain containing protein n=1 Tax=Leishmania braziliensis MHOM/BR/75/M2904 TaxID=420245 RepID=A0A3P3Z1I9_LEIBR|nr:Scavenger_mRNA_decapping_enzyme_C-term_binding/HIT_domain_containing_protein [Leishmania braziliensis MHOM/BR/75/M2904]
MAANCIFCKIITGEIPCAKVAETSRAFAFMDINPLSRGHVLVIPKQHAEYLHELDMEGAAEVGVLLAKTSRAVAGSDGSMQYNVLQNNGPWPTRRCHTSTSTSSRRGMGRQG